MTQRTLRDLFLDTLQDTYHAEGQLVKALPKMAKAANNLELKRGFEQHLKQTEQHYGRVEKVFAAIGEKAKSKTCEAMEGLIEEASDWIGESAEPNVMDAGLIAHAQKVEHYEIASYGSARTWAEQLGLEEAVRLLQETLDEEKETDEKLTQLALSAVNEEAEEGVGAGAIPVGRNRKHAKR
jgi:ferritin-like metal-binding protein YciE